MQLVSCVSTRERRCYTPTDRHIQAVGTPCAQHTDDEENCFLGNQCTTSPYSIPYVISDNFTTVDDVSGFFLLFSSMSHWFPLKMELYN